MSISLLRTGSRGQPDFSTQAVSPNRHRIGAKGHGRDAMSSLIPIA
jgi:hypothetical protein